MYEVQDSSDFVELVKIAGSLQQLGECSPINTLCETNEASSGIKPCLK